MTALPGFEWIREGRITLLVRSDVRNWVAPMLRAANGKWEDFTTQAVTGGRGGALVVRGPEGHAVLVRPYRRGGLPARWLYDTYFGWNPRPFRELYAMEALRQRQAPIVEVYGAAVHWLIPGCYRGWLATRYVPGARSLWAWVLAAPSNAERDAVFRQVGHALRRLHASGGRHPDLNLNNILLGPGTQAPNVLFIDFDRAHAPLCRQAVQADFARLRRSAKKLDPRGERVTRLDFDHLETAYRAGDTCA